MDEINSQCDCFLVGTSTEDLDLRKIVAFIGATVGGAVGWWIGSQFGPMTAYLASMLGTAAGVYFAGRWFRSLMP